MQSLATHDRLPPGLEGILAAAPPCVTIARSGEGSCFGKHRSSAADMTRRCAVQLLYILLLLFAQQTAYSHAAWHAGEHSQQHRKSDASFHGKLCGLHGVFCEVLGGIQGSSAGAFIAVSPASVTEWRAEVALVLPLQSPLSRGPPPAP